MIILFELFDSKVMAEDIFKLTTGNESLHETSKDCGVGAVNCVKSNNIIVMTQCSDITTCTCACPNGENAQSDW
jgi:hypothetical protein